MSISHHPLLGRRPMRSGPALSLPGGRDDMTLACGRVHELCGPARRTLALWLAARTAGPVLWVSPSWNRDRLHTCGMAEMVDPGRFVFVHPQRAEDVLWTLEEALRAGALPMVVGDIPAPPGLTQIRRMHLAAETGGKEGMHVPMGLLLTPGEGGSQGVESRWHMAPDHANHPDGGWQLSRLRARTAPRATWTLLRTRTATGSQIKAA